MFCRKLANMAQNSVHNIDPWSKWWRLWKKARSPKIRVDSRPLARHWNQRILFFLFFLLFLSTFCTFRSPDLIQLLRFQYIIIPLGKQMRLPSSVWSNHAWDCSRNQASINSSILVFFLEALCSLYLSSTVETICLNKIMDSFWKLMFQKTRNPDLKVISLQVWHLQKQQYALTPEASF
jgi:hypothetical protein